MIDGGRTDNGARRAIVVGAGGQDGSYLTDHLTSLGYTVIAIKRDHLVAGSARRPFTILDPAAVMDLIKAERPDEVYYLAAHHQSSQESVGPLRQLIDTSYDVHCRGLLNALDAIVAASPHTRLFYAASSLVFGQPSTSPQNEDTPMVPICIYGVTKVAGMGICRAYRREKGVFCCSGILYNHESPRRGTRFVTRKIVQAARAIAAHRSAKLQLGDLDAEVDWSYAGDIVRAMHAMLQINSPCDFVIASGILHSVRDFADRAFSAAELDYRNHIVQASDMLQRVPRKTPLKGDSTRLRDATGWRPLVSFQELVDMMVRAEMT